VTHAYLNKAASINLNREKKYLAEIFEFLVVLKESPYSAEWMPNYTTVLHCRHTIDYPAQIGLQGVHSYARRVLDARLRIKERALWLLLARRQVALGSWGSQAASFLIFRAPGGLEPGASNAISTSIGGLLGRAHSLSASAKLTLEWVIWRSMDLSANYRQ
jgi:hypothetical protein